MIWEKGRGIKKGGGGCVGKEQERLKYWRNVRENKQKGKQHSNSKEIQLVWRKYIFWIFFIALV